MNTETGTASAGNTAGPLDTWLRDRAREREEQGLRRELRPMRGPCVDLASNDYLGLSTHPSLIAAAQRAAQQFGVGATAYRALFHDLKLQPGQHLFINGGSSAVGLFAIQLAKAIGCTVTVSASGKKEEFLRSLGVDHVSTSIL